MTFTARVRRNIARERRRAGISQEGLGVRASLAGSLGIGVGALLDGLAWTPGWTWEGEFAPTGEESDAA